MVDIVWDDEPEKSGIKWDDEPVNKGERIGVPNQKTGPKTSTIDTVRGGVQSYLKGALLGSGDEVAAAGRTMVDRIMSTDADRIAREITGGETQSIRDAYKMYLQDDRDVTSKFVDEHGKTALALNVIGGIASPVNAIKTGQAATRLGQAGMNIGRGAAEGAAAGFMEGEGGLGDRLASAGQGAAFGAGASGAFQGATELGRGIANQRVAKNLVQKLADGTEAFRPLHMTAPGTGLGKFYRNVVGGAYGGSGRLGKQESAWINANPKLARYADESGDVVENIAGTRPGVKAVQERIDDAASEQTRKLGAAQVEADSAYDAAKVAAKRQAAESVDAAEVVGSRTLIDDAIPDSMNSADADAIRNAGTTGEAAEKLDMWWSGPEAFSQVKGRHFNWSPKLQSHIRNLVNSNPDVASEAAGQLGGKARMDSMLSAPTGTTGAGTLSGRISGDDLMAIRNSGAIGANKGGRNLKGGRKRSIAQEIDEMIGDQLGRDSQGWLDYQDQLGRYATKSAVSKAAVSAAKRLDDEFTPKDVGRNLSGARSAEEGRDIAKRGQRSIEDAQEFGEKRIADIDAQKAKSKSRSKNKLERVKQQKRAATRRLKRETEGTIEENKTFASKAINTAALGLVPSWFSPAAALPTGAAVAHVLASEGAQKAVAGQTGWQKGMRELGKSEKARMLARKLRENLARQAALQGTGE